MYRRVRLRLQFNNILEYTTQLTKLESDRTKEV